MPFFTQKDRHSCGTVAAANAMLYLGYPPSDKRITVIAKSTRNYYGRGVKSNEYGHSLKKWLPFNCTIKRKTIRSREELLERVSEGDCGNVATILLYRGSKTKHCALAFSRGGRSIYLANGRKDKAIYRIGKSKQEEILKRGRVNCFTIRLR